MDILPSWGLAKRAVIIFEPFAGQFQEWAREAGTLLAGISGGSPMDDKTFQLCHEFFWDHLAFQLVQKDLENLEAMLLKKGYSVSKFTSTETGNMEAALGELSSSSKNRSKTLLFINTHAYAGPDAEAFKSNAQGVLAETIISRIGSIPGDRIVVVDSCKAQGFVDEAKKLPGNKSETLAVLTSSRNETVDIVSDFMPLLLANAKKRLPISRFDSNAKYADNILWPIGPGRKEVSLKDGTRKKSDPGLFVGQKAARLRI